MTLDRIFNTLPGLGHDLISCRVDKPIDTPIALSLGLISSPAQNVRRASPQCEVFPVGDIQSKSNIGITCVIKRTLGKMVDCSRGNRFPLNSLHIDVYAM
ncbi:hypothetical protein PCANC_11330 [Puccinia coronata f. sp. avenae]|uniref:Uncharacterized protein n=1 Tax=Puccinia coronata f. sp. avenae TaxID=200324 RepID=A0A2N5VT40_9BASI|nr:hypothetical protein PCASD_23331 [Puccinia coronata f. sp. avenae]PLW13425.1 hypothetical protein PCANC_22197 [Puccinia coronata f. sp. avenae]PLW37226.1 hypothetical protein PCASD_15367 [Puccinia coronata f. sp. avenae]PLW53131.1 hypothetical protein PCANC_11330 [Puccinia coronata f. sp. avenae]